MFKLKPQQPTNKGIAKATCIRFNRTYIDPVHCKNKAKKEKNPAELKSNTFLVEINAVFLISECNALKNKKKYKNTKQTKATKKTKYNCLQIKSMIKKSWFRIYILECASKNAKFMWECLVKTRLSLEFNII